MLHFLSLTFSYLLLLGAVSISILLFVTIIVNLIVKVPFVPTQNRIIKHVVKLADIQKDEKVYDLGCGDGRFLIEAQKHTDKTVTGFEQAPLPYYFAKIRRFFSKANMEILMKNFLRAKISDADIIYCYLGPEVMNDIGEKVKKECRKGTRIFSHTFSIQNMEPVKTWEKDKKKRLPTIYLYQV